MGRAYGPEWVNKLYGMVVRNTTWNVQFVCLTDNSHGIRKEVECLPLPALALDLRTHVNGRRDDPWWNKVSLYRKDLHDLSGMTLYLDLDVVIVSSIDDLFTYPGRLPHDAHLARRSLRGQARQQLSDPPFCRGREQYLRAGRLTARDALGGNVSRP